MKRSIAWSTSPSALLLALQRADHMELGPIALAGPDDDCLPSTFASDRRSPFSRLGTFPAALQQTPHSHRAQRRQPHQSAAGVHSRPVSVRECKLREPQYRAAEQASEPARTSAAKAISSQPSTECSTGSSGAGGGSQPGKQRRRHDTQDCAQRLPFAAASMGGSSCGGRRRQAAASSLAGRDATFVLASVPHASYLFAEAQAPALASLLVLSDTVRLLLCMRPSICNCRECPDSFSSSRALIVVSVPQVRHVFAGTAARTMAQALIHPLDTVKTRLQVALAFTSAIATAALC